LVSCFPFLVKKCRPFPFLSIEKTISCQESNQKTEKAKNCIKKAGFLPKKDIFFPDT
jgi:hypothetical protein